MQSGPSTPETDYESLWGKYNEWLSDAKSTYEKNYGNTRARLSASGTKEGSEHWLTSMQAVERAYEEDMASIKGGATHQALSQYYEQSMQPPGSATNNDGDRPVSKTPSLVTAKAEGKGGVEWLKGVAKSGKGGTAKPTMEAFFTSKYGAQEASKSKGENSNTVTPSGKRPPMFGTVTEDFNPWI